MMKGIFVNEDGGIRYANAIVDGVKKIETRSRNVLKPLVGERIAIVRTRQGKYTMIIGYATITRATLQSYEWLNKNRHLTLIPEGSKYDHSPARWCYWMESAHRCKPYPLPKDTVRHGRSWCEF